jgi:hypothetical protein
MKWGIRFLVFFWVSTGLIGAWWLDDLDPKYWKVIAKGPFTLARAYNEHPPSYPGPDLT